MLRRTGGTKAAGYVENPPPRIALISITTYPAAGKGTDRALNLLYGRKSPERGSSRVHHNTFTGPTSPLTRMCSPVHLDHHLVLVPGLPGTPWRMLYRSGLAHTPDDTIDQGVARAFRGNARWLPVLCEGRRMEGLVSLSPGGWKRSRSFLAYDAKLGR